MKQITDRLHFAFLLIAACLFVGCTDDYDEAGETYYPSTEYYGYNLLDVTVFAINGTSIDNYSLSGGSPKISYTVYQYCYVSCYEGFPWRLTETPAWATFSKEEGVGPEEKIALTVYNNPSTQESRSATFYAESRLEEFPLRRVHTIYQQAQPLYFEHSPSDYNGKTHYFESEGGTLTYTLTTNQDWHIRIPSGQNDFVTFSQYEGTGNATLTVTVPPYDYLDGTTLKNTFYIYTGTADDPESQQFYFYIWQYPPSGTTVVEEAVEFAKEGGSQTLSLGNATSYTVSNSYSWLSVTPTSGEGNVELTVSALPNNTVTERTGTVNVKVSSTTRARITVTQKAHTFSLLDNNVAFEAEGGQRILVLSSSGAWSASSNADWLTVSPVSGEASDYGQAITLTAAENNSLDSRTAKVTFRRTDGVSATLTQTVTQTGHYFSAEDWVKGVVVGPDAQTKEIDFKGDLSWTASTSDSWITLLTTSGSASSDKVSFSVTANTSQESRTGEILVAYEGGQTKIPVVQESAYLNTSSATIELPSAGGGHQAFISSNAAWSVAVDAAWLKPSVTSGTGNVEVTFTADDNASATERTATITFTLGVDGTQKKMTITQKARYMNVPVSVVNFFKNGGSQNYYIDSDGTVAASSSDSWLTASVDKGRMLTLTAAENASATDRTATVTVSLTDLTTGEIKHTITVNQLNSNVFEYEDYGDDTSIDLGTNGAITVGKGEYGSDKPLDGGSGNSITIDKTGFGEDKDLNN